VQLLPLLLGCARFMAEATWRDLSIDGRTRGQSSEDWDRGEGEGWDRGEGCDEVEDERGRNGENVDKLRVRECVDAFEGVVTGGEGRRGSGMRISVYSGSSLACVCMSEGMGAAGSCGGVEGAIGEMCDVEAAVMDEIGSMCDIDTGMWLTRSQDIVASGSGQEFVWQVMAFSPVFSGIDFEVMRCSPETFACVFLTSESGLCIRCILAIDVSQ
jgi:hypothetical protein